MTFVAIYDTTLRDGTQREGISLSVADKLKITQLLDQLGVAYIEGGWPGSNPKDAAYFDQVRHLDLLSDGEPGIAATHLIASYESPAPVTGESLPGDVHLIQRLPGHRLHRIAPQSRHPADHPRAHAHSPAARCRCPSY